jgi:hypothetical protein
MVSPAVSGRAALPSMEGAADQWELWSRLDKWELRFFGISLTSLLICLYVVCFPFLVWISGLDFLVEMEDAAQVPRVGVSNYVASTLASGIHAGKVSWQVSWQAS